MVRERLGTSVLDKAVSSTAQTRRFLQNVMQYCTPVCSVLHVNTTASDFKFLFVFCLSEYYRKHDTVSANPNHRTLLTLARLWPSTKMPF